ncbi:uncharacterized protein [Littorina saxatilis]|uniref:Uncharacterized protein n=1 Tax=Littorina saxatilis TaxID=31220 RepID=A0AAN9GDU1_9CAEN
MPTRPTREETEKVNREIARIRRRVRRREEKFWKKNLFPHQAVKTDLTFWKSAYTDPHKIYKGNTDHWSKMRVQADRYVAEQRAKGEQAQSGGGRMRGDLKPADDCTTLPFIWSPTKAKLIQEKPFLQLVEESLGDRWPGCLSKGTYKNYGKNPRWPDNIFRQHAERNYKYWPNEKLYSPRFLYIRKERRDFDDLAL